MKKEFGDYYLGLDIGTNSVGWAVTDPEYRILDFRRKAMWGIHLFEEGQTAEDRRMHRCSRRRLERRKQRIELLREIFSEEICKVDPVFFERLDESSLHTEDRITPQSNTLFNDPGFTDKTYMKKFPTIYHLRQEMMNCKEKPDIRLVYLAIHHIIKYRGHFLSEGLSETETDLPPFDSILFEFIDNVNDICNQDISCDNISDEIQKVMTSKSFENFEKKPKLAKKNALKELLGTDNECVSKLLAGDSVKLQKLFPNNSFENEEISFADPKFDEKIMMFDENDDILTVLKSGKILYDWSVLNAILEGFNTISEAKISQYNEHKKDLKLLKKAVRKYIPEFYYDIFKNPDIKDNYPSYVKYCIKDPAKGSTLESICTQEKFCNELSKYFKNTQIFDDPEYADIYKKIKSNTLLPKQSSKINSILPYNIHHAELIKILDNVSKYYPFLNETDDDGYCIRDKILLLHKFRIPYYVGPLKTSSSGLQKDSRFWLIRKKEGKITPWNFEEMVDMDGCADEFIKRLTDICKYFPEEEVLPKNSIRYSRFQLYNELNNIRLNGERLSPDVRNRLIEEKFLCDKPEKMTEKRIKDFLISIGAASKKDILSGIDQSVKSNLKSENDFRKILHEKSKDTDMCDDIVRLITIFSNDTVSLKRNISKKYSDRLTEDEIKKLSALKYRDWGKYSKKFLEMSVIDKETGDKTNILSLLKNTSKNLNEIISECNINSEQTDDYDGVFSYDKLVADLHISPAVKRSIWRTLKIVREITEITGKSPKKVFVETTRSHEESKRTISRKQQLQSLFKNCKEQSSEIALLTESLEKYTEADLKGRNLYLYYTQHGQCMYCGKNIDIASLSDKSMVDRDHIYPQSLVKDDSIHNNMVLVCKECNQKKSNNYPLQEDWISKRKEFWLYLKDHGFITAEKFARLVRTSEFTDDEKSRFISRQLVETSQSVKSVIEILKKVLGQDTDIVYVKASMVSEFRQEKIKRLKCRSVNDFHHAKDAYLNIVVGNVHDVKFTKNPLNFIRKGESYNLRTMYDNEVSRNGICAWKPGETIETIYKYLDRNNIQFTKRCSTESGELFNLQLKKAKSGKDFFPVKAGRDPALYGYYNNVKGAYFCLAEYEDEKGKTIRLIETIPIYLLSGNTSSVALCDYIAQQNGVKNVRLLIPKILTDSLFEIDGTRCHINGRSNDNLLFSIGWQLLLPYDMHEYCRKISKYLEDKKDKISRNINYYGFDSEINIQLYDILCEKCTLPKYCTVFTTMHNNLKKLKPDFEKASLEIQAEILNEILKAFHANSDMADLKKIGVDKKKLKEIGGVKTGRPIFSKKINGRSVKLINQSITGLFEQEIDLNEL